VRILAALTHIVQHRRSQIVPRDDFHQLNNEPLHRHVAGAPMPERRFPPPWTVEELDACFVVTDSAGQKLAYVYFEDEPGRRSSAELLTKDEARRIAVNIAKLPKLVRQN
jgi:hypothetical protein